MSGFPISLAFNQPGYGTPTLVLLTFASNPVAYQAKPTDFFVAVDLSLYPGAGPAVTLTGDAVEAFPVTVRNVGGSGATHNWTVVAPAGTLIEDPGAPGSFVGTVTFTTAIAEGTWVFDRARLKFVLTDPDTAAAGPSPPQTATTPADSTPHVLATFALPASPSVTTITVDWVARDTVSNATSAGGQIQAVFTNTGGVAAQVGANTPVQAKGPSSATLAAAGGSVQFIGTGNSNINNWTIYPTLRPNTT